MVQYHRPLRRSARAARVHLRAGGDELPHPRRLPSRLCVCVRVRVRVCLSVFVRACVRALVK